MLKKIYYVVKDKNQKNIFSKLDDKQNILAKINEKNQLIEFQDIKFRVGKVETYFGTIYAYSYSKDLIKSSKTFNTFLEVLVNSIESLLHDKTEIENNIMKQINILIHNLISLNAHNLQEIYNIIPQEKLVNSIANKKQVIKNTIKSKPDQTALALLKLMKNNIAMKTEFSVFAKLFEENPKLNMKNHNIHRVLMNILYSFFPDFTDNDINVTVSRSMLKAYFDYESIYVAFFHLIENATKYIQKNSEFKIFFKDYINEVEIIFDMISLKIADDEKEKIFQEGYSGSLAIKNQKEGKGIGMSRVKKILELNNAQIYIKINHNYKTNNNDFQNNIFIIKIKKENYFI